MRKFAILVLALALMILPMAAMADALPAAVNGVITLTGDITLTETPSFSGNVKLTASQPVIITTALTDVFTANKGVTLTLGENITVNSSTSILYANGGKIIVDGAVLTTSSASRYCAAFAENGGTIEVKDGSITGKNNAVTLDVAGGTAIISGGVVISEKSSAVAVRENGTLKITDGGARNNNAPANNAAVYARGNNAVIIMDGGNVESAKGEGIYTSGKGKATINGGTVAGRESMDTAADGTIVVNGGFFSDDVALEYVTAGKTVEAYLNGFRVVKAPSAASMPSTGDNSSLLLWSALMVLACVGFVARGKLRHE